MRFNDFGEINEPIVRSIAQELDAVDFETELDGSNDQFAIRPCVEVTQSGQPIILYGIYNRATRVREAETRQYTVAKEWVSGLTKLSRGETLPGLGSGRSLMTVAEQEAANKEGE